MIESSPVETRLDVQESALSCLGAVRSVFAVSPCEEASGWIVECVSSASRAR